MACTPTYKGKRYDSLFALNEELNPPLITPVEPTIVVSEPTITEVPSTENVAPVPEATLTPETPSENPAIAELELDRIAAHAKAEPLLGEWAALLASGQDVMPKLNEWFGWTATEVIVHPDGMHMDFPDWSVVIEGLDLHSVIDQKYDGEIEYTEEEEVLNRLKGIGGIGNSRMRVSSPLEYSLADVAAEKEYIKARSPFDPQIFNRFIKAGNGLFCMGLYERGIIKLHEAMEVGTGYHELFHGIFDAFLDNKERSRIFREFASREGSFLDRESQKMVKYSKATPLQAEEQMAEEYRDFVMQGTIPPSGKRSFLQRVFDWLKSFFDAVFNRDPGLRDIQELFRNIDSGKYKSVPFKSPFSHSSRARTITIGQMGVKDTYTTVSALSNQVIIKLFSPENVKSIVEADFSGMPIQQIYNRIRQEWEVEFKVELPRELKKAGKYPNEVKNKLQAVWGSIDSDWDKLVLLSKEMLRTRGITAGGEEVSDTEATDTEYASKSADSYLIDHFATDGKLSATGGIKLLVSTIELADYVDAKGNIVANTALQVGPPIFRTKRDEATGLPQTVPFGHVFNRATLELSPFNTMKEKLEKLLEMGRTNPTYAKLLARFSGISNSLNINQWYMRIQGFNAFSRQYVPALAMFHNEDGSTYIGDLNQFRTTQQESDNWIGRMKLDAGTFAEPNGKLFLYEEDVNNQYWIDHTLIAPLQNPTQLYSFYDSLGIVFTDAQKTKMTVAMRHTLMEEGGHIRNALTSERNVSTGKVNTITIGGKTYKAANHTGDGGLGIKTRLEKVFAVYVKAKDADPESSHMGVEGQRKQEFIQGNGLSKINNDINQSDTIDQLREKIKRMGLPLLNASKYLHEQWFNGSNDSRTKIQMAYIDGQIEKGFEDNIATSRLPLGQRLAQSINLNLNDWFGILIPADSSTEWLAKLKNLISYENTYQGLNDVAIDTFLHYYNAEREIYLGDPRARLFATIKGFEDYPSLSRAQFAKLMGDFLDKEIKAQKKILMDGGVVGYSPTEAEHYVWKSLDQTWATNQKIDRTKISESQLDDILRFRTANFMVNNIEMQMLYFGDYADFSDPTKRYKSFMSPVEASMYGSPEFNDYMNAVHNKTADVVLKMGDPGYATYSDNLKTVQQRDVMTVNPVLERFENTSTDGQAWTTLSMYKQMLIKGARWNDGPLEALFQWAIAQDRQMMEADGVFDYEDYYTPEEAEALRAHDAALVKKGKPNNKTFNVIKPVTTGEDEYGDTILDKMSVAPLTYAMVRNTNLAAQYQRALREDISYVIYKSARKVGPEAVDAMYNEDGTPNTGEYNPDAIVNIPYRWFGIQQETQGFSRSQTIGTQTSAMASMNLMQGGIPLSFSKDYKNQEAARDAWELMNEGQKRQNTEYRLIREEQDYREAMVEAGYQSLLKRFGAVDTGDDIVVMQGKKQLYSLLQGELGRRQVSQNLKQGLALDNQEEFQTALETLPNYEQIKNILFSFLGKYIAKQKVGGAAHIMQSGSGFEAAGNRTVGFVKQTSKGNVTYYTSSGLRFYIDEDGKRNMEVMLPCWFADRLRSAGLKMSDDKLMTMLNSTEEGQKILKGIGFRIPTQDMNSMDSIVVKRFTPSELGQTVVVPEDLVTKAGSDFDVDKLNMYLKNIYITTTGEIKLIEYKGTKEETDAFYTQEWERRLPKMREEILDLQRLTFKKLSLAESFVSDEPMSPEDEEKYAGLLEKIFEGVDPDEDYTYQDAVQKLRKRYATLVTRENKLTEEDFINETKAQYLDQMYMLSLQNAYFDTITQILELPQNFKSLTTPNTSKDLEDVGNLLVAINPEEFGEGTEKSVLSPSYMNRSRHNSLQAKKGIGIAAVNQKNTAVVQKGELVIVPRKKLLNRDEDKWIGDSRVNLPSNRVTIDGVEYNTLSGVRDQDTSVKGGRLITSKVSQYIDGFVDFVKKPFLIKMGLTVSNTSMFLFLEKSGVPNSEEEPIVAFFMNQPIVKEYERMLATNRFSSKFSRKNINSIKNRFPVRGKIPTNYPLFKNNKELAAFLKSNIIRFYGETKAPIDNEFQHFILHEYLKYAVMSDNLYRFGQATNFDTAFISSSHVLARKQYELKNLATNNIFENKTINNTLPEAERTNTLLDNTFVGKVAKRLIKMSAVIHDNVFKLMSADVKEMYQPVLDTFLANSKMSEKDYNSACRKVEQSFMTHLLMNTQIGKMRYNERIHQLLIDAENSMAMRIKEIKKALPETPGSAWNSNLFIDQISVDNIGDKNLSTKIIKFINRIKDPITSDSYTNALEEIHEKDPAFFQDILTVAFLQSGVELSPISFLDVFPVEEFAPIMAKAFSSLDEPTITDSFVANDVFYRMRWRNSDIVPYSRTGTVKTFQEYRGTAVEALLRSSNPSGNYDYWMTLRVTEGGATAQNRIIAYRRDIPGKSPEELQKRANRGLKTKETILLRRVDETVQDQNGNDVSTPFVMQANLSDKTQYVLYVPINAWGDGVKGQESYTDTRMSKYDNGSYKVPTEPSNADLVAAFRGMRATVVTPEAVTSVAPLIKPAPAPVPSSAYKALTTFTKSEARSFKFPLGEEILDVEGHAVVFDGHPNFKSYIFPVEGMWVWAQTDTGDVLSSGEDEDSVLTAAIQSFNDLMASPENDTLFEGMHLSKKAVIPASILSQATPAPTAAPTGITFETDPSYNYPERTRMNAASADATIALAVDFATAGEKLTEDAVKRAGKKYIHLDIDELDITPEDVSEVVEQLNSVNAKTLNIAGNGIYTIAPKGYTQQEVDDVVYGFIKAIVEHPNLKNPIESIRSGGQSGIDEAGAKAGMKLGIPTHIYSTKGWKFKVVGREYVNDEAAFKARFGVAVQAAPAPQPAAPQAPNPFVQMAQDLMSYGMSKAEVDALTPPEAYARLEAFKQNAPKGWARYAPPGQGYEVSTAGNRDFSAFGAKLRDGRTIEDAYQLDVKGYRDQGGKTWRDGHGKPPVNGITPEQQWEAYKGLWKQYLGENPSLLPQLIQASAGKTLTDQFAKTDVNQARALAEIINEVRETGVAPIAEAQYSIDKANNRVTLNDGVAYPFFAINGPKLARMGYTPLQIGQILKETC